MYAGGTPSAGVDILTALEGETSVLESWHQKHLLWYHLGLGHEAQNRRNDAIRAYRRVLELLPGHRPALLRLAALGEDVTAALAAMEPEEPCNIDFGGKIRLLGYGLHREMVPVRFGDREASENAWFMTLSWQFNDHLYRDYHPIVHFCDDQGRILFQADHHIMSGGKPYPMDFPRCGEVVVETVRLSHDPTRARTLRIGIWSGNPPESLANHILTDFGSTTFFTRLGSDTDQAML